MLRATSISRIDGEPADTVTLCFEDRFRRRISMTADNGLVFLLDLARTTGMNDGDDLVLCDGRHVRVKAASEPLMKVEAENPHQLVRLAWHVGNRHISCEIHADYLVLRKDHVIADMLGKLGARVSEISAPFNPESGAYGQGRTHSHSHSSHAHSHD